MKFFLNIRVVYVALLTMGLLMLPLYSLETPFCSPLPKPQAQEANLLKTEEIKPHEDNESHSKKTLKVFNPISLDEALGTTILRQLEIKISELDIPRQKGLIQERAGPFDMIINEEFDQVFMHDRQEFLFGIRSHINALQFDYHLDAIKQTRLGTILSVRTDMIQIHDKFDFLLGILPSPRLSLANIAVRVQQELLRGAFGEGLDVKREKAAKRELEAVIYDVMQTISAKVLDTAIAYWNFVFAIKNLKIQKDAEATFEELLENVGNLIEGDEAAPGDLVQVEATLAIKRRNRISAAYDLYFAMKQLMFAMGIMDESIDAESCDFDEIIDIFTEYPEIPADINDLYKATAALVENGLEKSFDIRASAVRQDVAALIVAGLGNDMLPALNVFSELEQQDFKTGGSARHFYSAGDYPRPQVNWKIGASLSVPFWNDAAIGAYKQGMAEYKKIVINTQFLKEQVLKNILQTAKNQVALAAEIEQANQAVTKFQTVVANETIKLSAGFTTLFELISYKNSLIDSLILQNLNYVQFSRNLANLRFYSATLLNVENCTLVNIEDLTKVPFITSSDRAAHGRLR